MRRVFSFGLVAILASGCTGGPPTPPEGVEVGGKVVLAGGSPLKGGTLLLRPVAGIHGASAPIQPDGSFALADPSGRKAVVPGKYQVYVLLNDPRHRSLRASIPARYQDSENGDSDVIVEVREPKKDLVIRLKRG